MHMSDVEFEMRLIAALKRAAELDYMDMPSDDELERIVQPSLRSQRTMRALLRNPRRYVDKLRSPIYLRALRTAAVIFVVITVLFGTMMAVPATRATIVEFVRSWFEDRTEYKVPDTPVGDGWTLGYVPEGFELIDGMESELQIAYIYQNGKGETIFINISTGQMTIDNEKSIFYQTTINGRVADVYEGIPEGYNNTIVMYDDDTGVFITLISQIDINELIRIAKGISK